MATKKQLVELLKEYVESTGAFNDDDPIDYNDKEDFDFILHETLDELGACKGCRWYFDADRSCEKTNDCDRTCVNRLYNRLVARKNLDAIADRFRGVELKGYDWKAMVDVLTRWLKQVYGDGVKVLPDEKTRTIRAVIPPDPDDGVVVVNFTVKKEDAHELEGEGGGVPQGGGNPGPEEGAGVRGPEDTPRPGVDRQAAPATGKGAVPRSGCPDAGHGA